MSINDNFKISNAYSAVLTNSSGCMKLVSVGRLSNTACKNERAEELTLHLQMVQEILILKNQRTFLVYMTNR